MIVLNFLLKNWKVVLITLILGLLLFFANGYFKRGKTVDRIESNFANITKDNAVLNVTLKEYKTIKTKDTEKIDSLLKAVKIKPKFVQGATVINTVYKDTGSVKVIYKDVIKLPDGSYKIPFNFDSQCWGIKAEILSKDQSSTLNILERKASNSAQLIVTKDKYFLGFLWRTRKASFNGYSDCGKINFTSIEFVK